MALWLFSVPAPMAEHMGLWTGINTGVLTTASVLAEASYHVVRSDTFKL